MSRWDWKSHFYDQSRELFPFNLVLNSELRNLTDLLGLVKRGNEWVLDLGTGPGGVMQALHSGSRAVALDRSFAMIRRAKRRNMQHLVVADANRLPFKEKTFGLVTAIGVLEYQKNPRTFLAETYRAAGSFGHVVMTFAQPSLLNKLRFALAEKLYLVNLQECSQLLHETGFSILAHRKTLIQRQVLLQRPSHGNKNGCHTHA